VAESIEVETEAIALGF